MNIACKGPKRNWKKNDASLKTWNLPAPIHWERGKCTRLCTTDIQVQNESERNQLSRTEHFQQCTASKVRGQGTGFAIGARLEGAFGDVVQVNTDEDGIEFPQPRDKSLLKNES